MICAACMASAANYLTFTAEEDGSSFGIVNNGSNNPDVQYSLDGGETWTALAGGKMVTLAHKGDKALLRGDNPEGFSKDTKKYSSFTMTGMIAASGSVMSLIDGVGETLVIPANYCFYNLFVGCKSLTKAPELPATTLAERCYDGMFERCTNLTHAPALPATTLADGCYMYMFSGCTSLKQAPELPAMTLAERCYLAMFASCKSLTQAPALPATTLAEYCYNRMFSGCESLTQAPELPATTLAENCYASMFSGCTSLTKAPELPAMTLAERCYLDMFASCKSLTQAPALPATTLANYCYCEMFRGCTSLTQAPELPATTLAEGCYTSMFYGCTSLTQAPELPATTLPAESNVESGCYSNMFSGCTSLTQAPALPATTLADFCYSSMFRGCTSLSQIRVSFDDWNDGLHTDRWVADVAPTGTFICPKALPLEYGENRIPEGWTVKYIEDEANYLTFTAEEDGSSFGIVNNGSNNPDVQYSLDGGETWTALAAGDAITLAHKGDKALLRGDNPEGFSKSRDQNSTFRMTGKVAASGSVMSLIDGVGISTGVPGNYCFYKLFQGCTSLTQAPELPATTLAYGCYAHMFSGCTSLTQAPELPATTLAEYCYDDMFYGCTSLTQAPELPATTLAYDCYSRMFRGCTSLTEAPALPATTLADFCYESMFLGCTSLTEAPELPATALKVYCYANMFSGCTSLTQAPELPATTLVSACYQYMFSGCTSLTQAPELPAPELLANSHAKISCYFGMFSECTNLSEISVAFVKWKDSTDRWEDNTYRWVENVAPTGTFICPKALPLEYGVDRIPEGWTVKYIEDGSGVNSTLADGITVWTDDLTIFVCGAEGEVSLYDMSGKRVAVSNTADEERALCVPAKGAYVVRMNGGSSVVLVR